MKRKHSSILFCAIISGVFLMSYEGNSADTKKTITATDQRALEINKAPEGLKEIPFKDTNPELQPTEAEKNQGFVLFTRPITEPVFPETNPLPSERFSSLSAFAAPGEFEPVNFAIYPLKKLEDLRVTVSALKSGNNTIPQDNLDLRLVTCRNILYPNYQSKDTYRRMPELLEKVTVNTAPEKEPQRYWLKIKVPENAAPGIYKGMISISCDGIGKPVFIPVSFRVLPFKLEKDPAKHYTAYNYDLNRSINDRMNYMKDIAKNKGREWIYNAAKNEYKAMADYGFDTYPTIYLNYDQKTKSFYIIGGEHSMPDIAAAGMKGPVPAVWADSNSLYKAFTKKEMGKHHLIPEMPPEDFYKAITDGIIKFEKERKEKGWPEFVYVPLDEVDVAVKEFGAKVYKAFKDAGVKTYATKDPKSADAKDYAPYLDYWCSQPFSAPYEEVISSKTHGYWCYPNHNAYEIKDPLVMCRGGRMTYGFGLWRSGYTMLIPWIWRSDRADYLKPGSAGGNMLADDGSVIPAVYWECFREGIDDARYLYTLQQAIVQRENSKDKECMQLLTEGKNLIQEIWNNIQVQTKYLGNNVWDPREFEGYRWRMADMIMKLQKYPESNQKKAPSVIADYKIKSNTVSSEEFLKKQQESGNIEVTDLGENNYSKWKSLCSEAKMSLSENVTRTDKSKPLLFDVTVDHKVDGGGENGKYPMGWPRIRLSYDKNPLDLTRYDYITLWIMVDSARDEVADDFSPFYISINSNKLRGLYGKDIINEVDQRIWIPVVLSIKDMMNSSGKSDDAWKEINGIQFGISESNYKDGTTLKFYLDNISLVKFKTPAIFSTDMPSSLILPSKEMHFTAILMGTANAGKDKYIIHASLLDEKGQKLSETSGTDIESNTNLSIDTSILKEGSYIMKIEIKDKNGKVYSSFEKKLTAVNGPFMEK